VRAHVAKCLQHAARLAAGAGFQVSAELCEGRHLADPCELTLQGASNLDFRSRADATDGETTIRGGADARVDQLRLKEGLVVDAGNQVGADLREGRQLTVLSELTTQGARRLCDVHGALHVDVPVAGLPEDGRHVGADAGTVGADAGTDMVGADAGTAGPDMAQRLPTWWALTPARRALPTSVDMARHGQAPNTAARLMQLTVSLYTVGRTPV